MGLLDTSKLIFVFLVTVQACAGKNLLEKTEKFTVNFLGKNYSHGKKEKD